MSKIALCDARGPLNSLNDVLAGENGDAWLAALNRFLRKENPWAGGPAVRLVQMDVQKNGGAVTLREMLDDAKQYGRLQGAYDFYRQNPDKIPADWKGKVIFFPETEFVLSGDDYVRFVYWSDQDRYWDCSRLDGWVDFHDFVAVPASPL